MGTPDPGYIEEVSRRILALLERLRQNLSPGQLVYHEGQADHSLNRRLFRLRLTRKGVRLGYELGPNPAGERDETIRLLRVNDPQDRPQALLWNYACHPSASPYRNCITADYPGAVRQILRAHHGNIPILFFQGFSGDVRPPFRLRIHSLKSCLTRIALGPMIGRATVEDWERWTASLGECVCAILGASGRRIPFTSIDAARAAIPWPGQNSSTSPAKSLQLHWLRLGELNLVGCNAEMVVGYRALVRRVFPEAPLLTIGCLDQTWGYLPLDAMLEQGGYEVERFRESFDLASPYRPGIEAHVQKALCLLKNSRVQACIPSPSEREKQCVISRSRC